MNTNTAQVIPFSAKDAIRVVDGMPTTTTVDIAERFNKRHDTVLRSVRDLDCSPEFNARNFAAVEYLDSKGEKRPMYQITRDGFVFLCMGFTGAEAAKWKEAYINAFNEMEKELAEKYAKPEIINTEQQNALQQIIKRIAAGDGKKTVALWSRFNNHFRLGSYKHLSPEKFAEAVTYLEGISGEYLGREALPNALQEMPLSEQLFQDLVIRNLGKIRFMITIDKNHEMQASLLEPKAMMLTAEELPDIIKSVYVPQNLIPKIIRAVAERL